MSFFKKKVDKTLGERKTNARGFPYYEFNDFYGDKCSLQLSSLASDRAVWFGLDDAVPKVLISGQGWRKVELPPDCFVGSRMHLSQQQVRDILPKLKAFAKTGRL